MKSYMIHMKRENKPDVTEHIMAVRMENEIEAIKYALDSSIPQGENDFICEIKVEIF